jgi:putative membrane protein
VANADGTQRTGFTDLSPTDTDASPEVRAAAVTGAPSGAMRDAMANERTLLAWTRTSVAVIGLGFVVAKFALFLRNLGQVPPAGFGTTFSTIFGAIIVVLGSLIMIPALGAYKRRGGTIKTQGYRESPWLALAMGLSTVGIGIVLAVYLLLTD